jgi:serine/threonine-protein kinase RsbW
VLSVGVSVLTTRGTTPDRDTFAWTVLSALAGEVDSKVDADNRVTIELHKRRSAASTGTQ